MIIKVWWWVISGNTVQNYISACKSTSHYYSMVVIICDRIMTKPIFHTHSIIWLSAAVTSSHVMLLTSKFHTMFFLCCHKIWIKFGHHGTCRHTVMIIQSRMCVWKAGFVKFGHMYSNNVLSSYCTDWYI